MLRRFHSPLVSFRPIALGLLALGLPSFGLVACQAGGPEAAVARGPSGVSAPASAGTRLGRAPRGASPLEAGLAAIDPVLIGQDLALLASDELAGRDTPSRGLRTAARYIRHRLERLDFVPGAERGWFHEWVLVERSLSASGVRAQLTLAGEPLPLSFGSDLGIHTSELESGSLAGELVWCGAGDRDAFRGLELDGAVAVCLEGSESRARRRKRATDAGASGVLVLAAESGDHFAEWAERLARPRYGMPRQSKGRLPVFWLGGAAAAQLSEAGAALEPGTQLGGRFEAEVGAHRDVAIENVCGYWPGSNPELAAEVILISAHYDHVGAHDGEIYNGADDNASGSSALLALAEALAAYGPLERSVLLLWVSGEEKGLLGSAAWAKAPWLPGGGTAICNINFDMVGRNAPGLLEYTPTDAHEEYNGLAERVVRLAPLEGFDELVSADRDFERSDHASFARHLGVPVLYVSAGEHPDYHKPTDTADKIDNDKVARFTRLVLRLVLELQDPVLNLVPDREPSAAGDAGS